MNLQPILNQNSPLTHMESEFDLLGVAKNILVKYVIHMSKRKKLQENIYLFRGRPNSKRLVFGLEEF